jgi:EAL domain-containing protein (putative c-di-GMP-specific phosphodiesterase class I)
MQEGDTVARLGSDSFAVLATDLRADQVWGLVRKIRTAMQPEFSIDGHAVHATLGIGASVYPRDGEGFDILLRNADAAMHRAKAAGQNVFQFYAAAMTREATDRVELEHELRLAIERSELEIHFQPQIVLATGRLIGVEALMRWHHSARGPISPTRFIPIAEDSSLIYPLGEFALRQAIRQLKAWDDAGVAPLRVAVNVSARQFHSRGFLDMVGQVLREAEVDLDRFELELTESVLVEDQDKVIANLKRLKAIGVQIAVDDFGTGYSSLSYLSRLPIDCLKIDQSFVRRISEHGHDAAIAQAIISLAHALGLRVVAEGVETEAQQRFLNTHHCDEGQGYLFSRAVPADNIAALAAAGFSQAGGRQPI